MDKNGEGGALLDGALYREFPMAGVMPQQTNLLAVI